jgi:hypothetical protein
MRRSWRVVVGIAALLMFLVEPILTTAVAVVAIVVAREAKYFGRNPNKLSHLVDVSFLSGVFAAIIGVAVPLAALIGFWHNIMAGDEWAFVVVGLSCLTGALAHALTVTHVAIVVLFSLNQTDKTINLDVLVADQLRTHIRRYRLIYLIVLWFVRKKDVGVLSEL